MNVQDLIRRLKPGELLTIDRGYDGQDTLHIESEWFVTGHKINVEQSEANFDRDIKLAFEGHIPPGEEQHNA